MPQAIHLLEPSILTPDKYYKVYSTDPSLLFVKVGGQFYDEKTDDEAPLVLGLFMMVLRKLYLNKRKDYINAMIDRKFSEDPQQLLAKKSNFDITSTSIKKIELKTKSTMHTNKTDNGTLHFHLENDAERKFTIPSFVPRKSVISFFQNHGIRVEIL